MVHTILLVAAVLIGGSSETRKASLLFVSLLDEYATSSHMNQTTAGEIQPAKTLVRPKTEDKPDTEFSADHMIKPLHDLAPFTPAEPPAETLNNSGYEVTGSQTQITSSLVMDSGQSSVSTQTVLSSSAGAGTASVSRGLTGQATETEASLRQRIRDALQANLVYPYIARKRRIEGTVLIEFRINGIGMPEGVRILKGSSYSILDAAARETVLKSSPFPAIENIIEVPIRFSLQGD